MNLTKASVRTAAVPLKGQVFFRDDEITGFALRVLYTGAKTFVWEGRIKGRNRRISIGQYPDLSVAAAREEAAKIRGIVATGGDPAEDRLNEKRELTFADLVAKYLELHAKVKRRSWARIERRLELHFTRWNTRRISDISPEDVASLHIRIGKERGKIEANRAVELLRAVFNFGRHTLKWQGQNPAERIEKYPERSRRRFLSVEEMRRVNAALAEEENVYWRAYFPLDLALGLRKGDLLALRWDQIDLKARTIVVPTSKTDELLSLPLPSAAVRLLRALPRRDGSPWVFPGDGKTGHLVEPKAAWHRIRVRAKVTDVRIHDLRRTLGSWLKASGADLATIGRVLNHADPASTAVYARLDTEAIRPALEANAKLMRLGVKRKPAIQQAVG
jgi:integrase